MKIVAMQERSAGNAQVGDMWIDTAIFDEDTPLKAVIAWSKHGAPSMQQGRLMLSVTQEPPR